MKEKKAKRRVFKLSKTDGKIFGIVKMVEVNIERDKKKKEEIMHYHLMGK